MVLIDEANAVDRLVIMDSMYMVDFDAKRKLAQLSS